MLFNMLILGSLIDERGYVFHRSENNLFIVETTLPNDKDQVRIVLAFFYIMDKTPSPKLCTCCKNCNKYIPYTTFVFFPLLVNIYV